MDDSERGYGERSRLQLTQRRLLAIEEALESRLAGEIDVEEDCGIDRKDYEQARLWVRQKLAKARREKSEQDNG